MNTFDFLYSPASGIVVALIIAELFIRKSKYLIGYLYGLIPILGLWIAKEWWVISSCMACRSQQGCYCEWTAIGVVAYAFLAIIAAIIYSALVFGIVSLHRRLFANRNSTTGLFGGVLLSSRIWKSTKSVASSQMESKTNSENNAKDVFKSVIVGIGITIGIFLVGTFLIGAIGMFLVSILIPSCWEPCPPPEVMFFSPLLGGVIAVISGIVGGIRNYKNKDNVPHV